MFANNVAIKTIVIVFLFMQILRNDIYTGKIPNEMWTYRLKHIHFI